MTSMADECKVQLDASGHTEDSKQTTQGVKPRSKLTTALLVFALCLAAAVAAAVLVFNGHVRGPRQDEGHFGESFLNCLRSSVQQLILMSVTLSVHKFIKIM